MEDALRETLRDELADQFEALGKISKSGEESERLVKNICALSKTLNELNQTEVDSEEKRKRREADLIKNQQMHDLEEKKSKLDWGRAGFEMAKIIVPAAGSWVFYRISLRDILKFEETGRIVSTGGRDGVRLPNIFNTFKMWK